LRGHDECLDQTLFFAEIIGSGCQRCIGHAAHLIDVKFGVILDVEASRSIRQAEVGPSIDPELMIRMLVVGYVFAIRLERLTC